MVSIWDKAEGWEAAVVAGHHSQLAENDILILVGTCSKATSQFLGQRLLLNP